MKPRTLRLAAVQMVSANGRVAENLARAGQWAEQAARQGAELVLLPELFAIGYRCHRSGTDSVRGLQKFRPNTDFLVSSKLWDGDGMPRKQRDNRIESHGLHWTLLGVFFGL